MMNTMKRLGVGVGVSAPSACPVAPKHAGLGCPMCAALTPDTLHKHVKNGDVLESIAFVIWACVVQVSSVDSFRICLVPLVWCVIPFPLVHLGVVGQ